jgi:hypothetical protein
MTKDNVITLKKPIESANDVLSNLLRQGAQQLLTQAIEEEITLFLSRNNPSPQPTQPAQVVRNGYLPERNIQTGIGDMCIKIPPCSRSKPLGHSIYLQPDSKIYASH